MSHSDCLDQAEDQELLELFTFRACFTAQLLEQIMRESWEVLASMRWGDVVQWDVLLVLTCGWGFVVLFFFYCYGLRDGELFFH